MMKTGTGKTQATTVVHEGKIYRGTMPNLNMKTDLTGSFEYLATIVEGMSSGNMNGNPVFDNFKSKIIENTIAGEVGKLINERGHVPENYQPSTHLGRFSSQLSKSSAMPQLATPMTKKDPRPLPNLPAEFGKATDLVVKKMTEKKLTQEEKEDKRLDEAVTIDVGRRVGGSDSTSMLELVKMFDEWEKDYPFAKRPNESAEKRLKRIEKEFKNIANRASKEAKEKHSKDEEKRLKVLAVKITKKTDKKKVVKKKTKKKVAKKRNVK